MKSNTSTKLGDQGAVEIRSIILAMLALVIGVSLVSTVAFQSTEAQANASVTGATDSLVGILPIIFVALLLVIAVSFFAGRR